VNATLSTCGVATLANGEPSTVDLDEYGLRSAATTGLGICQDTFARDFPTNLLKKVIEEVKMLRPLYNGDFYPLTPINLNEDVWCAWQFDRPELGRGFAMFFRRPKTAQASFEADLHGLDRNTSYEVDFADIARVQTLTGDQLAHLRVEIPTAPGSLLVSYRRLDG